jgi:hypothetical protein
MECSDVTRTANVLEESPQTRFDREIYLHYLEVGEFTGDRFKHVSKEDYYGALFSKIDRRETRTSDKNNIYRIADERDVWLMGSGRVVGEVWKYGELLSYWIKI